MANCSEQTREHISRGFKPPPMGFGLGTLANNPRFFSQPMKFEIIQDSYKLPEISRCLKRGSCIRKHKRKGFSKLSKSPSLIARFPYFDEAAKTVYCAGFSKALTADQIKHILTANFGFVKTFILNLGNDGLSSRGSGFAVFDENIGATRALSCTETYFGDHRMILLPFKGKANACSAFAHSCQNTTKPKVAANSLAAFGPDYTFSSIPAQPDQFQFETSPENSLQVSIGTPTLPNSSLRPIFALSPPTAISRATTSSEASPSAHSASMKSKSRSNSSEGKSTPQFNSKENKSILLNDNLAARPSLCNIRFNINQTHVTRANQVVLTNILGHIVLLSAN
jgi:hypothetical protein